MKSLREYLDWAEVEKVAIGHFNISDSEGFKAVVEVAEELDLPVCIGVSEGERDFIGIREVVALVKSRRDAGQPVFLNADHTYSVEKVREAIDAGFDSVIIDGAGLSFEENKRMTKEVVGLAKDSGREVLVEGEIGYIGKSSTVLEAIPEGVSEDTQTTPEEAVEFIRDTGIDMLAPSVGNIHGVIKSGEPDLNIERIKSISEAVDVPLVLHGASGNSDADIRRAIEAGIRMIHINTEIRLAYKEGIKSSIDSDDVAPYKFMSKGVENMKKVIRTKMKLFNNL